MDSKTHIKSLRILLLAFVILLLFFRPSEYYWLYALVFVVWSFAAVIARLPEVQSKWRHFRTQWKYRLTLRTGKTDSAQKAVLTHLNYRVTEILRKEYPEAIWNWGTARPEQLAEQGGKGEILTNHTGKYQSAEVVIDPLYRVFVNMQEGEEPKKASTDQIQKPDANEELVSVWFEMAAKDKLHGLVSELSSQGYSRIDILESGEVVITEGEKNEVKDIVPDMPEQSCWKYLAGKLEQMGLTPQIRKNCVTVEW